MWAVGSILVANYPLSLSEACSVFSYSPGTKGGLAIFKSLKRNLKILFRDLGKR